LLQPSDKAVAMPGWRRIPSKLDKNIAGLLADNELDLFIRQRARIESGADLVYGALPSGLALNTLSEAAALEQPMQGMMLVDLCNYMVDDILVKVDRASMAVSLEVRAPFLDNRVVEFAWSLPLEMRYGEEGGKVILRDLLERYVPRKLTDRPKKGFGVPVADWLRGPLRDWAEDLLEPSKMNRDGLLKTEAIQQIWKQHLCGWKDHGDVLWSTLMFQAWLRDGGGASPVQANSLSA
jgi:asparagine synthase (glutamine-hydrolysing)